jgi:hypothetical protein
MIITDGSVALCWSLTAIFSFLILFTVGRIPWKGDQQASRPLPTHKIRQTQAKHIQISKGIIKGKNYVMKGFIISILRLLFLEN